MKTTGMVRQMDTLGRVVLPIELRRTLGIAVRDPIEVFVNGEDIILRKYTPACYFCNSADDLIPFGNRKVCKAWRRKAPSKSGGPLTNFQSTAPHSFHRGGSHSLTNKFSLSGGGGPRLRITKGIFYLAKNAGIGKESTYDKQGERGHAAKNS